MSQRVSTEAADPNGPEAAFIERHGIEAFKREYNNGWKASAQPGDSAKWNSGMTSDAWDSGYLDYAAGRAKWHLLNCPDHDTCGEA